MLLRCLGVTETKVELQGIRKKQYITRFSLKIGEESNKGITACILEVMSDIPIKDIDGGEDYYLNLEPSIGEVAVVSNHNRVTKYLKRGKRK